MCQLVNLIFELTTPPVMMATLQVHSIHLHQSKSVHGCARKVQKLFSTSSVVWTQCDTRNESRCADKVQALFLFT